MRRRSRRPGLGSCVLPTAHDARQRMDPRAFDLDDLLANQLLSEEELDPGRRQVPRVARDPRVWPPAEHRDLAGVGHAEQGSLVGSVVLQLVGRVERPCAPTTAGVGSEPPRAIAHGAAKRAGLAPGSRSRIGRGRSTGSGTGLGAGAGSAAPASARASAPASAPNPPHPESSRFCLRVNSSRSYAARLEGSVSTA